MLGVASTRFGVSDGLGFIYPKKFEELLSIFPGAE
jgi:hypothetical protein